jgi:hypothetical protein
METYGDEIQRYVAACALDEGVVYLPAPLDFAQKPLSEPTYVCHVCGNEDTDDMDGRCDFCTARFIDDHPLNMKPAVGIAPKAGENVTHFLKRDPKLVEARFLELKEKGPEALHLQETQTEDVQSAKLMVAYDYMQMRNRQLADQLEELKSWVIH